MARLWASTNYNSLKGFRAAYEPGQAKEWAGWCGGMSALWINNKLSGKSDQESKPEGLRAGLVQGIMLKDKSLTYVPTLARTVGLFSDTAPWLTQKTVERATDGIALRTGAVLIETGGHVVAAYVSGSAFYFYEPNDGLYLEGSKESWIGAINGLGYPSQYPDLWDVYRVATTQAGI